MNLIDINLQGKLIICVKFCHVFQVKFMEEDGADYGGVCQEFFRLFGKALISEDSKQLEIFEESGLVWFMSDVRIQLKFLINSELCI